MFRGGGGGGGWGRCSSVTIYELATHKDSQYT